MIFFLAGYSLGTFPYLDEGSHTTQGIERWIIFSPLSVNVFVTLAVQ
jgi:hypothetical protein